MIVYGDRTEEARPHNRLSALSEDLATIAAMPPGTGRHDALAAAFVALGQIVQGIADADRQRIGADGGSASEAALMPPLTDLGRALVASWRSGFRTLAPLPEIAIPIDLPDRIELRLPEGYAFYGLYPEAYAAAAARLKLTGPPRVIGIRSIGTGLAAIAATALDAPPPLTVRPIGHPFDRTIKLTSAAEAALIDPAAHYVVVDEGPGLSGSSFAAVADFLEDRGVPPARIAFLPGHAGSPGQRAGARTRARWDAAQRPVMGLDELIPPQRLVEWSADLIGTPAAAIEDISGGGWRAAVYAREDEWPAVDPAQEKRKFLIGAGQDRWLVKFSGIGGEAQRKFGRARLLHAAGFVPEVRGVVHGFIVQRWIDAIPLDRSAEDVADFAARYLGARARLLPAAGGGASAPDLLAMARFNIGAALGDAAAESFAGMHHDAPALAARMRPMATDNRCDPHEWLRLPDGGVQKADALDHDVAHDLIGAQDLAWDVAGVARLIASTEAAAGRNIDAGVLAFLMPCYLAFRLGAASMAADALAGWPQEQARNHGAAARYARRIASMIGG
jgi:hypothetical protein